MIRLVPEYPYVMLRNEHTCDGTHTSISADARDCNISIHGGSWEESSIKRGGRSYGKDVVGFRGVQTCMLFNNINNSTISDVTFSHTMSFSVQAGDLTDGVFENLYIRNFNGRVGDDLVALNMYDWLGSSINYGPAKNIFCEKIHSAPNSAAKAFRLKLGIFIYDDGTSVDCSLDRSYV